MIPTRTALEPIPLPRAGDDCLHGQKASQLKGRIKMKLTLAAGLLLAISLSGAGCALFGIETGYRWFTIKNHHFQPAQITVPKGVPFVLVVDAIDERDPSISAPELGITRLRIPSVEKEPRLSAPSTGLRQYARLPLGPLEAGHYTVFCECHGNPASANILVE